MIVYTVTMHAIYDHGCGGVFLTEEAAVAHARKMAEDSDGHHDFRIDAWRLNEPVDIEGRWGWLGSPGTDIEEEKAKRRHSQGEPEIEVVNRGAWQPSGEEGGKDGYMHGEYQPFVIEIGPDDLPRPGVNLDYEPHDYIVTVSGKYNEQGATIADRHTNETAWEIIRKCPSATEAMRVSRFDPEKWDKAVVHEIYPSNQTVFESRDEIKRVWG